MSSVKFCSHSPKCSSLRGPKNEQVEPIRFNSTLWELIRGTSTTPAISQLPLYPLYGKLGIRPASLIALALLCLWEWDLLFLTQVTLGWAHPTCAKLFTQFLFGDFSSPSARGSPATTGIYTAHGSHPTSSHSAHTKGLVLASHLPSASAPVRVPSAAVTRELPCAFSPTLHSPSLP